MTFAFNNCSDTLEGNDMDERKIRSSLINARKGLEKYLSIIELLPKVDVSTNSKFQKLYNAFFKIRHKNKNFYEAYYLFLEKHKNAKPTFTETLEYLYKFGRLEISFSSKLLAIIDQNLPVWDQFVSKYFGLVAPSSDIIFSARIMQANSIYQKLIQKYEVLLAKQESKLWLELFDEYYPNCNITPLKKVDLIIWQARGEI